LADEEQNDELHPFHLEGSSVIFDKPPSAKETTHERREHEAHEFARTQVAINRRTAWFNGLLVLATFSTVGIGTWQGFISQRAANAARDAVRTAEQARNDAKAAVAESEREARTSFQATINNFHREQRAYLIPGDPEDTGGYGLIRFPIINYGHTTASDISVSTKFERVKVDLATGRTDFMDKRALSVRRVPTIPPSEKPTFYMLVFIPQQGANDYGAELAKGQQDILARGTIKYDSGYGEDDTISWCCAWKPRPARWENCGGSATAWLDSAPNTNRNTNRNTNPKN
jgi:hypothetical protein